MNLKSTLVEKVSKKGMPYVCIEISLTDNIKKYVFLTQAEIELIKLTYNSK